MLNSTVFSVDTEKRSYIVALCLPGKDTNGPIKIYSRGSSFLLPDLVVIDI